MIPSFNFEKHHAAQTLKSSHSSKRKQGDGWGWGGTGGVKGQESSKP